MTPALPLHSPDWYRLAPLRLRLREGTRVSRQVVRGEVWHVLTDPVTGSHHRFNEGAYRFVAACDGRRTLDEVWAACLAEAGDAAPTQGEAIRLVAQAYAGNLLIGPIAPDAAALVKSQRRQGRRRRLQQAHPLSFRVPLWNPDAFLDRHVDRIRPLLQPAVARLLWALALAGLLLMGWHAGAIAADVQAHLTTPRGLLLMWLAYPLLKALHELAHGFVLKAHGGEVTEVGVTVMMLSPVPYVDANAAAALPDKRARAGVAAAGILVEAMVATLALALWLVLQPGLAREACLAVLTIAGLSTLLVNGNPLLRFDGYHALTDWLELPNLGPRSGQWWTLALRRMLLRDRHAVLHGILPGERRWLVAYAPLSWAWRLLLLAVLAVALAPVSAGLGLAVLAFALWSALLQPAWRVLRWLWQSPEAAGRRVSSALAVGSATLAAVLALLLLPVPERSHAPAVVWLPDEAILRLGSEARVEAVLVADGTRVTAGTPLVRLSNEELVAELAQVNAERVAAEVEHLGHLEADAGRAAMAADELQRLRQRQQHLQERVARLTLRAGVDGVAVVDEAERHVGRWLPQGHAVAHVLPGGVPMVRALVGNDDIVRVRERPGEVEVVLAHDDGAARVAVVAAAQPMATRELPSPALGDAAGGPLALDRSDPSGRLAAQARFPLDLHLPDGAAARVGTRAMVRFTHGEVSAAGWLADAWRRAFLRHFDR